MRKRARGFTLIELSIAVVLSGVLIGATAPFFVRSTDAFSDLTARTHFTTRSQVVVDRIVNEIVAGRFVSLVPPVPDDSTWIRFDRVVDFVDGEPVYGNPTQIEIVDIDGKGPVIRMWEDVSPLSATPGTEDVAVILSEDVAPDGLSFTRSGAAVEIQITFEGSGDGDEREELTVTAGAKMRNGS